MFPALKFPHRLFDMNVKKNTLVSVTCRWTFFSVIPGWLIFGICWLYLWEKSLTIAKWRRTNFYSHWHNFYGFFVQQITFFFQINPSLNTINPMCDNFFLKQIFLPLSGVLICQCKLVSNPLNNQLYFLNFIKVYILKFIMLLLLFFQKKNCTPHVEITISS